MRELIAIYERAVDRAGKGDVGFLGEDLTNLLIAKRAQLCAEAREGIPIIYDFPNGNNVFYRVRIEHDDVYGSPVLKLGDKEIELKDMHLCDVEDIANSACAIAYLEGEGYLKEKYEIPVEKSPKKIEDVAPWLHAAAADLECASSLFAIEFADRLYPRLLRANTMQEQLAAIRQAFIETVEDDK